MKIPRTYRFKVKKLIRDKMPDLLKEKGIRVFERILEGEEYLQHLEEKLLEEAHEAVKAKTPEDLREELADVLEVILSLGEVYGISFKEIEEKRLEKKAERGGFEGKVYNAFVEMDAANPSVQYYRSRPEAYPEIEE